MEEFLDYDEMINNTQVSLENDFFFNVKRLNGPETPIKIKIPLSIIMNIDKNDI